MDCHIDTTLYTGQASERHETHYALMARIAANCDRLLRTPSAFEGQTAAGIYIGHQCHVEFFQRGMLEPFSTTVDPGTLCLQLNEPCPRLHLKCSLRGYMCFHPLLYHCRHCCHRRHCRLYSESCTCWRYILVSVAQLLMAGMKYLPDQPGYISLCVRKSTFRKCN